MLQAAAVLAALATAKSFVDHPLVSRLLKNVAARSANKIDDWVIGILYGAPEATIPAQLEAAQKSYDVVSPQTRAAMKAEPSTLLTPDILAPIEINP